jgi:hypothetical protein
VVQNSPLAIITQDAKPCTAIFFYNTSTREVMGVKDFHSEIVSLGGFGGFLLVELARKLVVYHMQGQKVVRFMPVERVGEGPGYRVHQPSSTFSVYADEKVTVHSPAGTCALPGVKEVMNWAVDGSHLAIALTGGHDIEVFALPSMELLGKLYRGMLAKEITVMAFTGEGLGLISSASKLSTLHLYHFRDGLRKEESLASVVKVKFKSWEDQRETFMTRPLACELKVTGDQMLLISGCNFLLKTRLPASGDQPRIELLEDGKKTIWFR